MVERIIEFSARNKYLVMIVVVAAMAAATWCVKNLRLDAIPDLSDTQVIVFSRWDRSPDIIEDQVTYPIVTALLGVPKIKAVRGFSDFGYSYVYVIFEDGTDIYWARSRVIDAVRKGNNDVGGRLLEFAGTEFMVRARGYVKSVDDLEKIVVGVDAKSGTPILVKQVARVALGPDIRRGVSDLDGEGDTVGGIVVMRQGENALNVIQRVKARLEDLKPTLPEGVEVVTTYDRSELIERSIHTLKHSLIEEMIIVSIVILIFLWHVPSAIIPIITIPVSVFLAFIPFYLMGLTANIMSLAGIAISIGVLVDGAIVEVENAYKKLEQWQSGGRVGDYHAIRLQALKEVGPAVFFSLLVIAVAFLPVFTLVDQEGRLFKPLAFSKNLAMALAAVLAITLDPALRMMFTRMDYHQFRPRWLSWLVNTVTVGRYYPEEKHPVSRVLFRTYEPVCRWVLEHRKITLGVVLALLISTIPVYTGF